MKKIYSGIFGLLLCSTQAFGQYCDPTYGNDCTSGDFIEGFEVLQGASSIYANLTTGCANTTAANYSDYTGVSNIPMAASGSYDITMTSGPDWGQSHAVFIDLNQDLDFDDAGEFFDIGYAAAGTSITTTIVIPGGALQGTTTLRAMCQFGTTALTQADVCGTPTYGEYEDYTVDIAPPPTDDASLSAITSPLSGCGLTANESVTVEFTNFGSNDITSVDLCYALNGGTPVCETFTGTVVSLATEVFTFTTPVDLSSPGDYTLSAYLSMTGDANQNNDSVIGLTIQSIATITSLPYSEDFESGSGGWTAGGTASSWEHGVPAGPFIDGTSDCGTGTNAWVTNLIGDYNNSEDSYLESPCIDFSALTEDPFLVFDHIFETESCCDEGWVELSIDGGATWNTLGTVGSGSNWYNEVDEWNDFSGNAGEWRIAAHQLTGTAGIGQVKLRFRMTSDGSVTNDGFGVDNISIVDDFGNAQAQNIISPVSSCGMSATDTITANFVNNGADTLFALDVCYIINGGASVCETINDTLAPGEPYQYTFVQTGDFSTPGDYDVTVYSNLSTDISVCDDTTSTLVTSQNTITFPYSEDFESGTGGWITTGTNSTWEHGVPNGPFIDTTSECGLGSNAWVTNLTGDYNNDEDSYLESPCIDFTSLTDDPIIVFDHIFETEGCCDEGWLEVSTDGGITWTKLGTTASGSNWYNDVANDEWDGTSGNAGEWRTAAHELTGTAGQGQVKLRFAFSSDGSVSNDGFGVDNISIVDSYVNVATTSIDVASGCGLSAADSVVAEFTNMASDTLFTLDVCFTVDGSAQVCETINDTLAPGEPFSYTFSGTADLSAIGNHDIVVYTNDVSDMIACDDTMMINILNKPMISSYPYFENFENGESYWAAEGVNNTWELGTPAHAVIQGAASGDNAWVNGGLTGIYSAGEDNSVVGPCFDFTTLPTNAHIAMKVWYETEFSWDGAAVQMSADTGATWITIGLMGDQYNWYSDNSVNGNPGGQQEGWSGSSGQWIQTQHLIDDPALIGAPHVLIRVAFGSDGSGQVDGFAFDDIAIGELPTVDLGVDVVDCGGVEVTFPSTGNDAHTWNIQADTAGGAFDLADNTDFGVSNGNSVEVINPFMADTTIGLELIYSDDMGLTNWDTILVTVSPAPFNVISDTLLCIGDSLMVGVDTSSNYTYSWSPSGETTDSVYVQTPGMYSVTVTDVNSSCAHTADFEIMNNTIVDILGTTILCENDSVMLDATMDNVSYLWSTTETDTAIYVNSAGQYYVDVTDLTYGCMSSDSITITAVDIQITGVTNNEQFGSDGSIDISVSGGLPPYTFLWNNAVPGEDLTGISQGLYTVEVTDGNGCTDTASFNVGSSIGIGENIYGVAFEVFPNPSNGEFSINIEGNNSGKSVKFELLNSIGQVIATKEIDGNEITNFDFSKVETGIYYARLTLEGYQNVTKVVFE